MINKILAISSVVFFVIMLIGVFFIILENFKSLLNVNHKRSKYSDLNPLSTFKADYYSKKGLEHQEKAASYAPLFVVGLIGTVISFMLLKYIL